MTMQASISLILLLIIKLYSFVNYSPIFKITTKERLFPDSAHHFRYKECYRSWLFPGCAYPRILKTLVIDPGCFRVAYTYFSCFRIKMYVIDPGYFQVAYTTSSSSWRELGVIDPGYFQVAYT